MPNVVYRPVHHTVSDRFVLIDDAGSIPFPKLMGMIETWKSENPGYDTVVENRFGTIQVVAERIGRLA